MDFVILNATYAFTCLWNHVTDDFFSRSVWLMLNVAFLAILHIFSSIHARRVVYADRVLLKVVKTVAIHAAIFLSLLSFLDISNTTWRIVLRFYLLFFSCLGIWWILARKVIKWYRSKGFNYRRIVVIGGGNVGMRLIDELKSDLGYGYRIMGLFDDNPQASKQEGYIAPLSGLADFLQQHTIDEMYCAIPDTDDDAVAHLIKLAEANAIDFYYVPQFGRHITRRFELESIGNVPILSIRPYPLGNPFNRIAKRMFDFIVSSVVLVLSPIVLIPVAIGIKLSSPGPVFSSRSAPDTVVIRFIAISSAPCASMVKVTRVKPRKMTPARHVSVNSCATPASMSCRNFSMCGRAICQLLGHALT